MNVGEPLFPSVALVCPACQQTLEPADDGSGCVSCGWSVLRKDGLWILPLRVPSMLPEDSLLSVDPDEDEGRGMSSWDASQANHFTIRTSAFFNGGWIFFQPIPKRAKALLIETGSGGAALALAPHVESLWVCNPLVDCARTIVSRVQKSGQSHVTVLAGSINEKLPFPTGAFDFAVVHGLPTVLPLLFPEKVTGTLPILVRDLKRVVKSLGFLYLDGRTQGLFSMDARDSVPRAALRRALAGTGLTCRAELVFHLDWEGRPYKVQNGLGQLPLTARLKAAGAAVLRTPVRGLIATAPGAALESTPLEWILRHFSVSEDVVSYARETLFLGSSETYRAETDGLVLRIPTTPAGTERCRRNIEALRDLEQRSVAFQVPRPAGEGVWRMTRFFSETRLLGKPVPYLVHTIAARDAVRLQAQEVLAELYRKTRRRVLWDQEACRRFFGEPLERIAVYLDAGGADAVLRAREWLLRRLPGQEWDLVRTHGDYKATNFLLDGEGRLTGVVDWDLSRETGLPLSDMILCEAFDRTVQNKIFLGKTVFEAGFGSPSWRFRLLPDLRSYAEDEMRWNVTALMTLVDYFFSHLYHHYRWVKDKRAFFSNVFTRGSETLMALSGPSVRGFF